MHPADPERRLQQKWQWIVILVCCIWLCLLSSMSHANTHFKINDLCQVKVEYVQKVKAQSHTQIPATGWQSVSLPDNWQRNWNNYHGGAWYKLMWNWSCQDNIRLAEPIAFSIDYINSAGAVFLNGDLLWSDQNLQEPLSKSWNMPRYWILPTRGLNTDSNEILIYVQGYSFQNAGLGQVEFNNVLVNSQKHLGKIWDRRTLFQMNMIFSVMIGIICFIVWQLRRSETAFGWLALSSFLWVLFISNVLTTESFPFHSSIAASKANMLFFIAYIHCFSLYLIRFLKQKFKYVERGLILTTLLFSMLIVMSPLNYLGQVLSTAFIGYVVLFISCIVYVSYQAITTRNGEYLFLMLCLWGILLCGIVDLIILMQTAIDDFSPLSPYTSPMIILFVVLIMAARLNRNIRKIEKFNTQLERKVQQVSADLNRSLSDRHKLELDNVRLQERINLSHELHDGLGGSIVRSMILVDQSTDTIPNRQFLSMLKLLRDDLRQIIDSGSSIDNKVPETPILWIAPVRYRFTQLMEEMNIEVEWFFPKVWQREPTALQCLTLIRVVEESLTNIIKHSQASQVKVSLEYSLPHQLTLTIQDNGIGFDTEMVQKNGLSIGMRSMKMRVERMGGVFQIESEQGNTLIRVVLELYQP
ncbi:MAG: ATP-binding protein [Acinetobacter sp.]